MFVFDLTNPVTLGLMTVATALLIFLGKEIKKPVVPAIALIFYLILVIIHSVQLATVSGLNSEETTRVTLLGSLGVDLIMIFITFFGYLWVDDLAAKFYKKKSIDSSLNWFWNKV